MTTSYTDTFNRDDIRRVYASFGADYKIVAEWTRLHDAVFVERTVGEVKAIAEEQYLAAVHMQLKSSAGKIKKAAVYRVSTDASRWSSDRPGDLYWDTVAGDTLQLIVFFTPKWFNLTPANREAFSAEHMSGWGRSGFNGNYGSMVAASDRRFASGAYGLERTRYE